MIKKIKINNIDCAVQAYLKDDFVNLWVRIDGVMKTITINFKDKDIFLTGISASHLKFIKNINIENVAKKLLITFGI